jgi:hypothetical protein
MTRVSNLFRHLRNSSLLAKALVTAMSARFFWHKFIHSPPGPFPASSYPLSQPTLCAIAKNSSTAVAALALQCLTRLSVWDTAVAEAMLKFSYASDPMLRTTARQFCLHAASLQFQHRAASQGHPEAMKLAVHCLQEPDLRDADDALLAEQQQTRDLALALFDAVAEAHACGSAAVPGNVDMAFHALSFLRDRARLEPVAVQYRAWHFVARHVTLDAAVLQLMVEAIRASRDFATTAAPTGGAASAGAFSRQRLLDALEDLRIRSAEELALVLKTSASDRNLAPVFVWPCLR